MNKILLLYFLGLCKLVNMKNFIRIVFFCMLVCFILLPGEGYMITSRYVKAVGGSGMGLAGTIYYIRKKEYYYLLLYVPLLLLAPLAFFFI